MTFRIFVNYQPCPLVAVRALAHREGVRRTGTELATLLVARVRLLAGVRDLLLVRVVLISEAIAAQYNFRSRSLLAYEL